MNKLVSIIVPAYNVEKYISECLDSLVNQTYKNIEIILINDGSKDNTGKICAEYSKRDKRIKYLDKENSGVSDTRNVGLDMCKGYYVLFVDSDDWIELNAVELLMNHAEDADIVKFNCSVEDKNHKWKVKKFEKENHILTSEEIEDMALNVICPNKFLEKHGYYGEFGYICGKLYNRKVIGNLRFKTQMRFCEDGEFFLRVLKPNIKIKVVDEVLYYYRNNESSCMRKYRKNMLEESRVACDAMETTLNSLNQKQLFQYFKLDRFCHCLANFSLADKLTVGDVKKFCEEPYWTIKKLKIYDEELSKKRKILFFMARNKLYWVLYLVCKI